MAELKTLNGYEIVDETARNTKQNKVLYGAPNPFNTLGFNGDLYIATNGVGVINDLQSQINDNSIKVTMIPIDVTVEASIIYNTSIYYSSIYVEYFK